MRLYLKFGFAVVLCFFIASLPALLGAEDRIDGLVVFWSFDSDNLKTVPNDVYPSEAAAYMQGWVSSGIGIRGRSADFINQKGSFISDIPDVWLFSPKGVSVGMFIYSRGLNENSVLFSSAFLEIRGSVVPDHLEIEVRSDNDNIEVIYLQQEIPKEKWIHLTVTISHAGVELYLDGAKVVSDRYIIRKLNKDENPVRERVYLGAIKDKNGFNGEIDEVVIFSKKIDEYEISWLL